MVGTATFAISGALTAAEKKFDLLGILFIGFVTAVGGGTIRDLLLGNYPVFWVTDLNYFLVIFISGLITFLFIKLVKQYNKILLFPDAIGLGVFTIIGIKKSLIFNIHFPGSIMMGVSTAVMGGVIRDVLTNRVPLIMRKEIYATACIAGGIVYYILAKCSFQNLYIYLISAATVSFVRIMAIKYNLYLPSRKL